MIPRLAGGDARQSISSAASNAFIRTLAITIAAEIVCRTAAARSCELGKVRLSSLEEGAKGLGCFG